MSISIKCLSSFCLAIFLRSFLIKMNATIHFLSNVHKFFKVYPTLDYIRSGKSMWICSLFNIVRCCKLNNSKFYHVTWYRWHKNSYSVLFSTSVTSKLPILWRIWKKKQRSCSLEKIISHTLIWHSLMQFRW